MAITILCGPVGAGKSTWIQKRMDVGDVVIDMDSLGMAITQMPLYEYIFDVPKSILDLTMPLRTKLIELAVEYYKDKKCKNVWIAMGGANPLDRKRIADKISALGCSCSVYVFQISHNICRDHIKNDPQRGPWQNWDPIIKKWWTNYIPRSGEIVISSQDLINDQ